MAMPRQNSTDMTVCMCVRTCVCLFASAFVCARACVCSCASTRAGVCIFACIHVLLEQRDRAIAVSQDQCKLVNQLTAERDSISTERDQVAAESCQHQELLAAARAEVGDYVSARDDICQTVLPTVESAFCDI